MMEVSHLKPVPKSQESWNLEFAELFQRADRDIMHGRKELLLSMMATQRLRRPTSQGLIFIMGSSGVGKSSTINHLFNLKIDAFRELAKTNSAESETMEVREYILQSASSRYEASDIVLGIVDTPGFHDTGGLKQEACNMHAIKKFVCEHPCLRGSYPNLILICFDATDVRFLGDGSNFGKFMKCLSKLKLVDQDHPNVIAVITKCCSLRPDYLRKPIEWKRNLENLQQNVRQIIEKYLFVDVPVVVLENHHEEEVLVRPLIENDRRSDFTMLPNGELQPYNLFKCCSNILKNHNDLFGEICFNATFLEGNRSIPRGGFAIAAKDATITHLNREEEKLLNFLENVYKYIQKNEIKLKADEFIASKKLNEREKQEIETIVHDLNKLGMFKLRDVQYLTLQSFSYHSKLNISNFNVNFITDQLKIPHISSTNKLGDVLVKGYNIFTDSFARKNVFNLRYHQHRYGLTIPTNCELNRTNSVMTVGEISDSRIALINKRLSYLRISSKVCEDYFEYNRRSGFHLLTPNSSVLCSHQFTYFESWQLRIDFSLQGVHLTDNFINAVGNLPRQYSQETMSKFKDFFYDYGHFYVASTFAGGSYEKSGEKTGCNGGHRHFRDCPLKNSKMKKLWLASIMSNPVILTTCMDIQPICNVVALIDSNKANHVLLALSDVFRMDNINEVGYLSKLAAAQMGAGNVCDCTIDNINFPLTRAEAVEFESKRLEKVLSSIFGGILGLLAIAFFPVTIIVAFAYARLGE